MVLVSRKRQFLWQTEFQGLAVHNTQYRLSLHGKRPKLGQDDVIAKPIHTILNQLSKTDAASGLKLELSVFDDFGG